MAMWKWIAGCVAAFAAIAALALWAVSDPEVPRSVMEAKYATAPSQFVTLADGTRIHYRDRGPRDAPVLILLHGFAGTLFVWEPWTKSLSAPQSPVEMGSSVPNTKPIDRDVGLDLHGGSHVLLKVKAPTGFDLRNRMRDVIAQVGIRMDVYRVISLDLPGHGLTGATPSGDYSQAAMAESLRHFADKLGLKRFALAGNSMGVGVAARFAELHPERVTYLILIDAAGARTSTHPCLHLAALTASVPVVNRFFLHFVMQRMPDVAHMEGSPQAVLEHLRLPDDNYAWEHTRQIKAPTLILWGGNDRVIPIASAYAWKQAIPGAKLVIYPKAGHVSMADAPAQSAADVRKFLQPHLHYEIRINNTPVDPRKVTHAVREAWQRPRPARGSVSAPALFPEGDLRNIRPIDYSLVNKLQAAEQFGRLRTLLRQCRH